YSALFEEDDIRVSIFFWEFYSLISFFNRFRADLCRASLLPVLVELANDQEITVKFVMFEMFSQLIRYLDNGTFYFAVFLFFFFLSCDRPVYFVLFFVF